MEADFWMQKWQRGETAFHEKQVNPALVQYLSRLELQAGSRIFVPLCGKTLDIGWLLQQGYKVVGAELSVLAITELFAALNLIPDIIPAGKLTRYSAANIDIFVGDIFLLTTAELGPVNAIYDRAALVALPERMRRQYSEHLMALTNKAPQLLLTYEYEQLLCDGPPFSVSETELQQHYGSSYQLTLLERIQLPAKFRHKVDAAITVWGLW